MSKHLYRFNFDCGRMGNLDGLFVASEEEVKNIVGKDVYFGEVLGKHSEISGTMKENYFEKLDIESDVVEKLQKIIGDTWSGFNPIEIYNIEHEDDEPEEDE